MSEALCSREEPKEAARAAEAAKSIYKKAQDILGQVESLALVAQAHMFMVSKLDATEEFKMEESYTVAIFSKVSNMKSRGEKVNGALCVGQPDFPPPPEAIKATAEAAVQGLTSYTAAISEYLEKYKQVTYSTDEILVACGGKGMSCLPRSHSKIEYSVFDPEVCNPSNPTGCAMSKQELEAIAEVLRRPENQHVLVLSDEIYERICYDGLEHKSFATLKDMWSRTLTINGFSKAFSMTGYRLGYLAAQKDIVKAVSKLQSQITSCASSIGQHAGIAALKCDMSYIDARVVELQEKRDLAISLLAKIPDVQCPKPSGAFYLFPDISAYFGRRTADEETIED
eukprot:s3852_g3.t2